MAGRAPGRPRRNRFDSSTEELPDAARRHTSSKRSKRAAASSTEPLLASAAEDGGVKRHDEQEQRPLWMHALVEIEKRSHRFTLPILIAMLCVLWLLCSFAASLSARIDELRAAQIKL